MTSQTPQQESDENYSILKPDMARRDHELLDLARPFEDRVGLDDSDNDWKDDDAKRSLSTTFTTATSGYKGSDNYMEGLLVYANDVAPAETHPWCSSPQPVRTSLAATLTILSLARRDRRFDSVNVHVRTSDGTGNGRDDLHEIEIRLPLGSVTELLTEGAALARDVHDDLLPFLSSCRVRVLFA